MPFERAAKILEQVEAAPRLGIAAPVAEADLVEFNRHQSLPQSRIRAARSWLFALGYMRRDDDRADYTPALKRAVMAFQKDAGLTEDGWIGTNQTWPRLQELVTFEKPLDLAYWTLPDGMARPALKRAVRARLAVYGIGKRKDGTEDAALMRDVLRFYGVLETLGAAPPTLARSPAERLGRVMLHDAHLDRIVVAAGAPAVRRIMDDLDDEQAASAGFGLLLNMAKVELWLAQETEVSLGTSYRGRINFARKLAMPNEIRRDMRQYMAWVDAEVEAETGLRRAFNRAMRREEPYQAISLFLRTVSQHGQVEEPFAEARLAQLDTFYAEAGSRKKVDPAAETVEALTGDQSFRSRLWDGLRRIWSWAKTALARAIATGERVLRLARDLAAYAFRAASEGLRHILGVIGAFVQHADTAIGRNNRDARGLVWVNRELGRDINLIASPGAPAGYLQAYTEQLSISAQIFRRAAAVLGRAIALGFSLVGAAVNAPLILRTLIIVARNLRETLSYLGEISSLQSRHDDLDEVLQRA